MVTGRPARVNGSGRPGFGLGAVQTPAYALGVFTANAAGPSTPTSADTPAELAAARADRYQQLADEKQRTWILIMSEAALNWHAGSPTVGGATRRQRPVMQACLLACLHGPADVACFR
jgi:uncharacterized protein DUF5753